MENPLFFLKWMNDNMALYYTIVFGEKANFYYYKFKLNINIPIK